MSDLKVTKCEGEGMGTCKRCFDNGKWNRMWMYELSKIEGYEGCYCRDCVKAIVAAEEKPDALGELLKFCKEKNISLSIMYNAFVDGYTFKAYDAVTNDTASVAVSSVDLQSRVSIETVEHRLVEYVKTTFTRLLHLDLSEFDRKVKKFTREVCPDEITIHPIPGEIVRLTGEDARKYWEEHKED